jgi:hypothetical protein
MALTPEFFENVNKSVSKPDTSDGRSPLEHILKERAQISAPTPVPSAPQIPSSPLIGIDGYVLPADALTLMMYLISTTLSKDKKIQKILKAFNFKFYDINGVQIYPKVKK